MRKRFVLLLTLTLLFSATASAQRGKAKKPSGAAGTATGSAAQSSIEPLRSIGGELNGRTVAGAFNAKGQEVQFTFTLNRADIVGDRVQLSGDFALGTRPSHKFQSQLVGIQATADNPWPGTSDEPAEEKPKEKPAAQAGKPNEQTQSLYVQAEADPGCGAFYLTIELPQQLRTAMGTGPQPLQMNLVLAPMDNAQGEQISRLLCRVHRILNYKSDGGNPSGSLEKLNRLLSSSK